MQTPGPITYRPDIDGLRAIAILSVLSFHFFPTVVPGGYIGVDVFFVISGYLISSIIFKEVSAEKFSFLTFYARRVRRIFPALIVVIVTVFVSCQFLFLDHENKELTKHVIRSALFVLNFTLKNETGYFDGSAESKPFLHLWSLSVEEQFYIVFPLGFFIFSLKFKNFGTFTLFLFFLSLGACIALTPHDQAAAFYLPFTRFWEIFAGVLIAYFRIDKVHYSVVRSNIMAVGGAIVITSATLMFEQQLMFPGAWALIPTIGASLIIAAGPDNWLGRNVLSQPMMIAIGLISYPLYLWHWPLLSIATVTEGRDLTFNTRLLIVAASFALAWATYVGIERPLRNATRLMPKFIGLSTAMAVVLGVGLLAQKKDGVLFVSDGDRKTAVNLFDWKTGYRQDECFIDALDAKSGADAFSKSCGASPTRGVARPHILIWGDSHAASLYPGLREVANREDYSLGQYTAAACPPVLDFVIKKRPECTAINNFVLKKIAASNVTTLILGGYWRLYNGKQGWEKLDLAQLEVTISRIRKITDARLILFLHLPIFKIDQHRIGLSEFNKSNRIRSYRSFVHAAKDLDEKIKSITERLGVDVVSPIDLLCNVHGCLISASDQVFTPLAWDYAHLNDVGSKLLIDAAIKSGALSLDHKSGAGVINSILPDALGNAATPARQ